MSASSEINDAQNKPIDPAYQQVPPAGDLESSVDQPASSSS